MQVRNIRSWQTVVAVSAMSMAVFFGHGCTPEQADAVLAGLQVTTDQLSNGNDNSDGSFRDWLSSQLDN